jgi:hypothetical protein
VYKNKLGLRESFSNRLEDLQMQLDNWATTKMPTWSFDKTYTGEDKHKYVKGKDYAIHDIKNDLLYINGKNPVKLNKRQPIDLLNKR